MYMEIIVNVKIGGIKIPKGRQDNPLDLERNLVIVLDDIREFLDDHGDEFEIVEKFKYKCKAYYELDVERDILTSYYQKKDIALWAINRFGERLMRAMGRTQYFRQRWHEVSKEWEKMHRVDRESYIQVIVTQRWAKSRINQYTLKAKWINPNVALSLIGLTLWCKTFNRYPTVYESQISHLIGLAFITRLLEIKNRPEFGKDSK
jgi:hypothetical protein